MTAKEALADFLMLAHACFSIFVVYGLPVIVLGRIFLWPWTLNRRLRWVHLMATGLVTMRVWLGIPCPLSVAEDALRLQAVDPCPLGYWSHEILHRLAFRGNDPTQFAWGTSLFCLITVILFWESQRQEFGKRPSV